MLFQLACPSIATSNVDTLTRGPRPADVGVDVGQRALAAEFGVRQKHSDPRVTPFRRCIQCGYLQASELDVASCPECGAPFAAAAWDMAHRLDAECIAYLRRAGLVLLGAFLGVGLAAVIVPPGPLLCFGAAAVVTIAGLFSIHPALQATRATRLAILIPAWLSLMLALLAFLCGIGFSLLCVAIAFQPPWD